MTTERIKVGDFFRSEEVRTTSKGQKEAGRAISLEFGAEVAWMGMEK
jgi:hypothetical protein